VTCYENIENQRSQPGGTSGSGDGIKRGTVQPAVPAWDQPVGKSMRMKQTKKDIARVLTVIKERQRAESQNEG
jgi:hypothetical protein